jgi:uncharacterized protein YlxP (DUF503 family)
MAQSLKAKRSIVQSIVRTVDGWKSVASAEVGYLDKWQRAELGFAVVSSSADHASEVADSVERFVWSQPDIEVTSIKRSWTESS